VLNLKNAICYACLWSDQSGQNPEILRGVFIRDFMLNNKTQNKGLAADRGKFLVLYKEKALFPFVPFLLFDQFF